MTQVAAPPSDASPSVAAPDTVRVLLVDDQAIIGEAVGSYGGLLVGLTVGGGVIYWWFRRWTGTEPLVLALEPQPSDAV